jgi:protein-S-isoprenylcysteine O-methyltransferase Ste14
MNAIAKFSQKIGEREGSGESLLKPWLVRAGRLLFTHRLEVGLGVTAVVAPFVRPTIAAKPLEICLKAVGLGMVLTGLGVRMCAAGFAGRHTRSSNIEGGQLATAGPYAYVRNPIYFGSIILGFGMVLLIGDRRLLVPCVLTFLALYLGLIPAEEEFLSQKFQREYEEYRRHVPRLLPRYTAWSGAVKTRFDWQAVGGEWRLSLILALIWGGFRSLAVLRDRQGTNLKTLAQ